MSFYALRLCLFESRWVESVFVFRVFPTRSNVAVSGTLAGVSRFAKQLMKSTIEKPPSAELKPNQKDQDTLPPYDVLDEILQLYVEENLSARDIIARGFDEKTVRWVQRRVDLNEYKREQAAPGLKVTSRAFGMGRKMPIAQRYVD